MAALAALGVLLTSCSTETRADSPPPAPPLPRTAPAVAAHFVVPLTPGAGTGAVAYDPGTTQAFVVQRLAGSVAVVTVGTDTASSAANSVETGSDPWAIAGDPDNRYVLVTNRSSQTVSLLASGDGAGVVSE